MSEQDMAARLERLSEDVRGFTDSMNNEDGYFELADAKLLRDAAAALRRLEAERDKLAKAVTQSAREIRRLEKALSGASAQGPETK